MTIRTTLHRSLSLTAIAGVLLLGACSSSKKAVSTTTTPTTVAVTLPPSNLPPATVPKAGTTIAVGRVTGFGNILVDGSGLSLYLYTPDTGTTSTCTGGCASAWPPAPAATGTPVAGDGVAAANIGSTTRADGTKQLTYAGHPLYTFKGDAKPGDTTGEGEGGNWFLVSPAGDAIKQ